MHTNDRRRGPRIMACFAFAGATLLAAPAGVQAQSAGRAVFVANNGNLEGSVTAFAVNPDGTVAFVNRIVTGTRASLSDPCSGCNAYEISLTPGGRFVATAHAAGDLDGITVFEIASNAAITLRYHVQLPVGLGSPLDLVWLDDEYLAATRTDTSPDQIVVYRWDDEAFTLTPLAPVSAGGNSLGYMAVHPCGSHLYVNDSAAKVVRTYEVGPGGALALVDTDSTGAPFPLELTITRDGTRLYSAGGISDGGNKVIGLEIGPGGLPGYMPGSPYTSPGVSPSNVFPTPDGKFLFVGHGTDATVRSFAIDAGTGALTSTGFMFDIGLQGTLGDVATLENLLFVTDNSTAIDGITGLYSFTVQGDGSFVQNGPITLTQGIAPRTLAAWRPPLDCPADCAAGGDGMVDISDLLDLLAQWQGTGSCNLDECGTVDVADLLLLLAGWGGC
jgi:6-phosphogluconolactonase (cycloisomerase 2 family)